MTAACAVLMLASMNACKKTVVKSKTELLTEKAWIVTSMEQRTGNGSWVSTAWASSPACEKDDQTVFRTNNTYEMNEGSTKCDPSDPHVFDSGTWAFQDNESKLVMDRTEVSNIEQLDENTLIVTSTETIAGTTYSLRVSLRH
jgi:hypothetical protein